MSLNGLDAAAVKEAYEAAVAEAGGWFLLKYATRDEIEVHCQGKNGIVEMRNAIAEYEEPSPLYGFLKYRRRNVIVKYQPDDCSRLIQARATVHFNAVCERFTPYNTMFEITEAKELKDTKLSAACSLHAASGSCSSSTSSLRRRRLMEITEEEEEEERERKRQSVVEEEDRPSTPRSNTALSPFSSPEPPVVLDKEQIEASKDHNFASTAEEPTFEGVRPMSPGERRLSSSSGRPNFYDYSAYYGKPKVKLGPRPSLETNKNPHTASNFRPVAALPAGFKLASKGSRRGRSGSHDQTAEEEDHELEQEASGLSSLNASMTIPEVPAESEAEFLAPRPTTSSGASMKSVSSTAPVKESKITPEKARLMKAMKMRQEKKKLSLLIADPAYVAAIPESMEGNAELQALVEEELSSANIESDITADLPTPMTMTTEATEDTFTDSHPPSPTVASSEIGESTKASSVSESTDETVQASKDESTHPEEDELPIEDDEDNDNSDIRAQDIEVPPSTDDIASPTSPKSPYGIPVSRFASNDGKSPTTPSLKSKFSTQDLRSPVEQPIPAPPTVVSPPAPAISTPEEDFESESRVLPKRRATVAPIRIDHSHSRNNSEGAFHDVVPDDDLLDALQSATFEEAQPMSVSKSPITPVFPSSSPKRPQTVSGTRLTPTRSFTQPMRGPLLAPSDVSSSSARSVSAGGAALLHNVTRQPSSAALSTKKPTSSSIAQRIKALEQLSGKKAGAEEAQSRVATATSLVSTRKQGVRETSKSPVPSLSRASSRTRQPPHSPTADMDRSRDVSPAPDAAMGPTTRGRSGSVASRLSKFEAGGPQVVGRPDSIQVTARIVRDGQNSIPKRPSSKDPAEYSTSDLKQSPLFVDHLKAVPEPITSQHDDGTNLRNIEQPKETIQERRMSRDDRKASISEDDRMQRRRSSLGIVKDFIKDRRSSNASKSSDNLAILSPAPSIKSSSRPPSVHQVSGSSRGRRLSVSSRRSSFSKDRDSATPVMSPSGATDHSSDDADKSSPTEKRSNSRTSRFMRRLSNTLTATRKTASPNTPTTVREEEEVASEGVAMAGSDDAANALSSYMGDVNVQFPDNLLWKRRSLCLDTNGFLILNALNGTEKTGLKRYHLSDFRAPYIPDVDMQELPNSICLDFVAGSALQLACEDRQGQQHVLAALREAHHNHMAFGQ